MSRDPQEIAGRIRDSLPESGLFADKAWRVSPKPFPLSRKTVKALRKLGPVLHRFQKGADSIYRRSKKGTLPSWIGGYLDRGKPDHLLAHPAVDDLPRVIRPDLILTEDGYMASELDSVPGGIGLTAWLGSVYSEFWPEKKIVGGVDGVLNGFQSIFEGNNGVDILVSEESGDYRPEMKWLADQVAGDFNVRDAENYEISGRDVYRFFELFDVPNIPGADPLFEAAARNEITLTSPCKPWLEEKMWSALFWSLPLRDVWRQELRDSNYQRLKSIFPRSWIVEPLHLPHQAAIPGLEIQSFAELKDFSQTERELVLKLSGFNERAWGSRSVTIGHDVSQAEWGDAVEGALEHSDSSPYILQRFHSGVLVEHPWLNPDSGKIEIMSGRVRLCPYYFVEAANNRVNLGGVLATICPADKKVIHGMSEAIMVPCSIE